jgi:hypothetical protein
LVYTLLSILQTVKRRGRKRIALFFWSSEMDVKMCVNKRIKMNRTPTMYCKHICIGNNSLLTFVGRNFVSQVCHCCRRRRRRRRRLLP